MKKILKHKKTPKKYINWIRYKDLDSHLKLELCDECKPFGYCKGSEINEDLESDAVIKFYIEEYLNKVPVKINNNGYGKFSKVHLQIAFDAFHQEDYETAILHFKATREAAGSISDAFWGLAVSYFMIKDYENASKYMQDCYSSYYKTTNKMVEEFFAEIDRLTVLKESIENATIEEKEMYYEKMIHKAKSALQGV